MERSRRRCDCGQRVDARSEDHEQSQPANAQSERIDQDRRVLPVREERQRFRFGLIVVLAERSAAPSRIQKFCNPTATCLPSNTAFATGTSWGTMGILMPLVVPLTWGVMEANGFVLHLHEEQRYGLVHIDLAEFPVDQPIRIRVNPADLNALSSVGAVDVDPLAQIASQARQVQNELAGGASTIVISTTMPTFGTWPTP